MLNKRFYNYQTQAGHDIKVVLDDDRQHVMIEIRGHLERNLYFPEFVDLLLMIESKIDQKQLAQTNIDFEYLQPLENKTTHAIRCHDDNKSFILLQISENLKVKNKFVTQYHVCVAFSKWLKENYRIDLRQTEIDINLCQSLINDQLIRIYRI